MYFITPLVLFYLILKNKKPFVLYTFFYREFIAIIIFIALGIVSIIGNYANLIDGIYTIGLRLIPIILMIIAFDIVIDRKLNLLFDINNNQFNSFMQINKYKWFIFMNSNLILGKHQSSQNQPAFIQNMRFILKILIFLLLSVGTFQYFFFNKVVDNLGSLPKDAHQFSFFSIFGSLFLLVTSSRKIFWLPVFCLAIFLSIMADFKLGLAIFFISLLITLILYPKNNRLIKLFISFLVLVILSFYFEPIIIRLPNLYRYSYYWVKEITFNKIIFTLDSPLPFNAEILKGYMQLPLIVLNSPFKFMVGVGPGNYSTNIALYKEKEYARKFVLPYQAYHKKIKNGVGTFGTRSNMLINIIAEFGLFGVIVYFYLIIRILLFPIKFYQNNDIACFNLYISPFLFIYFCTIIYSILFIPFFGVFEESFWVSSICLTGIALIMIKQNIISQYRNNLFFKL